MVLCNWRYRKNCHSTSLRQSIDHSGFSLPRCVPEWNHVDASPWTEVVQVTVRSEAVVAWSKGSGAASGRGV